MRLSMRELSDHPERFVRFHDDKIRGPFFEMCALLSEHEVQCSPEALPLHVLWQGDPDDRSSDAKLKLLVYPSDGGNLVNVGESMTIKVSPNFAIEFNANP